MTIPLLMINALVYPYRVDSIKQTYKHGYIYIYTNIIPVVWLYIFIKVVSLIPDHVEV
jgi:hypothetical protein